MDQLTDLFARRAELTPHAPAMREALTGTALTYAEMEGRTRRAAGLLLDLGVREGDRVAVLCRNRIAFFELLFACAKIGAILVPLNWRMPAAELAPLLAETAPKALFHGAEDRVAAHACAAPEILRVDLDLDYERRLEGAAPARSRDRWPADQPWYLLFTSGTTGAAKAVIQTYGMALINAINIGQAIDLTRADATLNFLPLFHTGGINLYTLPTLIVGGSVHVLPGFDAGRMYDLIDAGALSVFFGVPTVYQQLAAHPRFADAALARVRRWGCGGAPLSDVLARKFAARGVCVCNGFGMTETGPTVFLQGEAEARVKFGSVGRPQILSEARIVDAAGAEAPIGAEGELWIRGPGLTPGYWRRDDLTRAVFTEDGWLRTGDIGRRDEDGDFWIVGRMKEMYISGGENVFPAEVENVLAQHPGVVEAAVVGVPDERWGEVGRAFVIARDASAHPRATELDDFCRARLAAYKVPRSWVFVEDLPRTAAGKVQKHLLPKGVCV